jgi:hypothetical protein
MKRILIIFLGVVFSCKNAYNLPKGNLEIEKIDNSKYTLQYPKDWKIRSNHAQPYSIRIERFKKKSLKNAWFILNLDLYESDEKLQEVINSLIEKDYILKLAEIISIKHYDSYSEVICIYKIKQTHFKKVTRFYIKDSSISQISFSSKEKDYNDFSKYRKLFFGTFKWK